MVCHAVGTRLNVERVNPAVGKSARGEFAKDRPRLFARCRSIQAADKRLDQGLGTLYLAHLSTTQDALPFGKGRIAGSPVPCISLSPVFTTWRGGIRTLGRATNESNGRMDLFFGAALGSFALYLLESGQ